MAHAYLLSGKSASLLQETATHIAAAALGVSPELVLTHPDFHPLAPQSKSRQITVEQVRTLERAIYLKPMQAPRKVAVIAEADRLCVGQAAAANAFLKTLEEPPADTLLILTTTQPQEILPTIASRCMRLELFDAASKAPTDAEAQARMDFFLADWESLGKKQSDPALCAYARAALLQSHWQQLREGLEDKYSTEDSGEEAADKQSALIEGDLQRLRQQSLAALQRWFWSQLALEASYTNAAALHRAIGALETLGRSLAQHVDPALAAERACLMVEGLAV